MFERVRGPEIPEKSPENSRMKVCSRDKNIVYRVFSFWFGNEYVHVFSIKFGKCLGLF